VRRMIFSCTGSSLIYDDIEVSEKIKIYDHGVSFEVTDLQARQQVLVNYRRGEMRAPAIDNKEALATELHELAAVLNGQSAPVATGEDGLDVVRILEAIETSIKQDGTRIML